MSYPPPPGGDYQQVPRDHPEAQKAMIMGIVALVGGVLCGLPYFVGPFAWRKGKQVMSEIDASAGRMGGRGQAQTGYILGIVATVLLIIGVVTLVLLVGLGGLGAFLDSQNT
jgi:hypothetical protein